MSYLKKFDIDFLKIDQSFVRNLTANSEPLALCEAIIVMAHKLGIKVIAEGVETEAQQNWLAAAECDYTQGYYSPNHCQRKSWKILWRQALLKYKNTSDTSDRLNLQPIQVVHNNFNRVNAISL